MPDFVFYVIAGFMAQLIDGALGMAYGVTASSLLMAGGVSPAVTSATVHAAECFTTGASALSHRAFGNVDGRLFRRLVIPGMIGAVLGAYVLSNLPGEKLRPFVAAYLLVMGVTIVCKSLGQLQPRRVTSRLAPLGFIGAFVDAIGGGGWGPIVASTLLARGNPLRMTVGSVNAAEFLVTAAAAATFVVTLGLAHFDIIAGLALGGLFAAPLGAYVCRHVPLKPFTAVVGLVVIALGTRTLLRYYQLI